MITRYRQITELRRRGLTYQAIAQELGITVGSVKSVISKGKSRQRDLVDERGVRIIQPYHAVYVGPHYRRLCEVPVHTQKYEGTQWHNSCAVCEHLEECKRYLSKAGMILCELQDCGDIEK